MKSEPGLSRRERQIMDAVFSSEWASIAEIRERMPEPPSLNAVRTMVQILEEKGQLRRRKRGREFEYAPVVAKAQAGLKALRHVIATFFEGSVSDALAAHFSRTPRRLSKEEHERLQSLIDAARKEEKP
ncbi:MAG TPA: BlaI/MecI/CopY family transcriptional regulator [Verrucomicrobiales bacterium]|nr:BlaI/MecI/CopY family transcriptional regulator [Verrucomicrobiales bacterium]